MITVYKITLVGYVVDEDYGDEHPVTPQDWTPQQIIEEMNPNIEKTVVAIDAINRKHAHCSEYQPDVEAVVIQCQE